MAEDKDLLKTCLAGLKRPFPPDVFTVQVNETQKTQPTERPTEKLSCYVDKILQPITKQHKSYPKDTLNRLHQLRRKIKVSERSDAGVNGRYELIHKYTTS